MPLSPPFMLALQVYAPLHRELKGLPALLQQPHRLRVRDGGKGLVQHILQALQEALFHHGVEEIKVLSTVLGGGAWRGGGEGGRTGNEAGWRAKLNGGGGPGGG